MNDRLFKEFNTTTGGLSETCNAALINLLAVASPDKWLAAVQGSGEGTPITINIPPVVAAATKQFIVGLDATGAVNIPDADKFISEYLGLILYRGLVRTMLSDGKDAVTTLKRAKAFVTANEAELQGGH